MGKKREGRRHGIYLLKESCLPYCDGWQVSVRFCAAIIICVGKEWSFGEVQQIIKIGRPDTAALALSSRLDLCIIHSCSCMTVYFVIVEKREDLWRHKRAPPFSSVAWFTTAGQQGKI